jgi:WD40 repeat protein
MIPHDVGMAEVSGKRTLRPFPALDPEPPRRMTWRRMRWPAVTCAVAGAVAAVLLTWPSSSASRPVGPFADRDGLVVFEQQPSGLLGTSAPDGSHPVMLTRVGTLQGNDLPVASSDGRYLVNLEGQLVTMGPAGPASISNLTEHESQAAVAQSVGSQWANASFADGSRYVVATQCQAQSITSQSWVAMLFSTGSEKVHAFGTVTSSAGDPESAGALVSAPASQSAASSAFACFGQETAAPDKAVELLRPGQAPRTIVTAAALSGALGYRPGTPVQLSVYPSPDGTRLAVVEVSAASRQQPGASVAARPEIAVITRAGAIVAHMALPPATIDVQWSPDGHQIASCGFSAKARSSVTVWTVGHAARTIVLPGRHDIVCTQLLWSPDGSQLIYAAQTTEKGLTQSDNLQRGWTVIDLRSGRVHDVTAPGQPAAWLPGTARTAGETR